MRLVVVADEYPYRTKQILCCEQIANDLMGGAAWHYVITTKMAKLHPSVRDQHDARGEDVSIQPECYSDLKDQIKIE